MTIEEYVNNPMGKNNSVVPASARELMRKDYGYRYNNLLLRENGKIDYKLYRIRKDNVYIIHIKIPSEVVNKFYYDVILRFSANSDVKELGTNLEKYNVQFFSNDPAFVYTYAHVFMREGLFVKDLLPKMSKLAIKEKPKVKNPNELKGYVKSIYFAYLYMKERGLFKTISYGSAKEYNKEILLSEVEDADQKIEERQVQGAKVDKRKKIQVDLQTARNISKFTSDTSRLSIKVDKVPKTRKIKTTGKVKKK